MRKGLFILSVLISLLSNACSGIHGYTPRVTTNTPSSTVVGTTVTELARPSPNQGPESGAGSAVQPINGLMSECTLVSSSTKQSSGQANIFLISEDDWTLGPDDAAVTIIEYGDFQ